MDRPGDQGRAHLTAAALPDLATAESTRARTRFDVLFPLPSPGRSRRLDAIVAIGVWLLGSVLLASWHGLSAFGTSIWAEDGSIFLEQAATGSFLRNLVEPYAGYMHLVPRVIAEPVAMLPPRWWAWSLALAALAVRGVAGPILWYALAGPVRSRALRLVPVVAVYTLPIGSLEVYDSIANLHWFAIAAGVVAAGWRPVSRRGLVVQVASVCCAILSDPLALVVLPVIAMRIWMRRSRAEATLAVSTAAASLIQVAVVLSTTRQHGDLASFGEVLRGYVLRVLYSLPTGVTLGQRFIVSPMAIAVLSVLVLWLLTPALLRVASTPAVGWLSAAASVLVFAICAVLAGPGLTPQHEVANLNAASRYSVVGQMLLLVAIVVSLDRVRDLRRSVRVAWLAPAAGLVIVYLVGFWNDYSSPPFRSVPTWTDELVVVEQECDQGAASIPADIEPASWTIDVPCSLVTPSGG